MILYTTLPRGGVVQFHWTVSGSDKEGARADINDLFKRHFDHTLHTSIQSHSTPFDEITVTWVVPDYAINEDLRTDMAFLMLRYN